MIRSRERRKAPRHEAARRFARFGWWEGDEFRHTSGRLGNLSSRGAALFVDVVPERAPASGWFCIAGRSPDDWLRARVVAITKGAPGSWKVRLEFDAPCPSSIFQEVVWGGPAARGEGDRTAADPEAAIDDEEVVPPRRPEPAAPAASATPRARGRRGRPGSRASEADAESWAAAVCEEAAKGPEPKTWAEVRAEMATRRHARLLPVYLLLGIEALLIGGLALVVSIQLRSLDIIRTLVETLNAR